MTDRLRPLALALAFALLAACSSTPTSSPLGELPRTPQASVQQLLEQAADSNPEDAPLLRLTAANQSLQQGNARLARQILDQVELAQLKPAQQLYASTLDAELALLEDDPERALQAIRHDSFQWLQEMPVEQQVRSHLVRARAFAANDDPLAAVRERVFVAPLLDGIAAMDNHEAIWTLVYGLPDDQLQATGDEALDGWLSLAATLRQPGTLSQQQAAIDAWRARYPMHPASVRLPEAVSRLREMTEQPLERVALLLPLQGPLASVADALRDGFLAAHLQARDSGQAIPHIQLYDSTRYPSLEAFYQQAQADGVQFVVGPLEKETVRQLGDREQLPITTLALNYTEAGQQVPPQLFQFGLAAEDEAREVARRAWTDGQRSAIALVPPGEWGTRVLEAFQREWLDLGGTLVAAEAIAEPVALANQIADLLQVREGSGSAQPVRRQDVDFLFLAATPQQAQQVKPILIFQYAGDLPVYATSHLNSATGNQAQYLDLEGVRFAETPWLLQPELPLRQQVEQQWPQAGGSLGRLYAMGADAYLLVPRLNQLVALPETSLEGVSGRLSLDEQRRVERELPWAVFQRGQVVPLTEDAQDAR